MKRFPGVLSSSGKPVSSNRKPFQARARGLGVLCQLFGFFLLFFFPLTLRAASVPDAVHELAMKVCTLPHRGVVRIVWQESPGSTGEWSDTNKKAFLEQISACGIATSESPD